MLIQDKQQLGEQKIAADREVLEAQKREWEAQQRARSAEDHAARYVCMCICMLLVWTKYKCVSFAHI